MTFDDRAFNSSRGPQPLSDPRKAKITVKQLFNHTSGIRPEATGARQRGHVAIRARSQPVTNAPRKLAFDAGHRLRLLDARVPSCGARL